MNRRLLQGSIRGQAGFTIIEIMIAIAIFSIGFMAVGGLQFGSMNRVRMSQDKTVAMSIMEDQVELLKRTPLYMDDAFDNDGADDDGDGDPIFDLSPVFREDASNEPDRTVTEGGYQVHLWVDNLQQVPNRWVVGGPANILVSKTVRVAVTRTGGDPTQDALMSVEFIKCWVTDF